MALQVAGLLDELMVNPEWMKQSTVALNKGLGAFNVAPGYNVMVTIAGRSYVVFSDANGHLSVSVVPNSADSIARAMAQAHSRIIISSEALDDSKFPVDAKEWGDVMMANRKLQYTGDIKMLDRLEKELGPHIAKLRDAVEAQGPGSATVKAAIEDYNHDLKARTTDAMEAYYDPMQIAVSADTEQPLLMKCVQWLLFSAGTTMSGNMGQSNYAAANCVLDAMTFHMRQTNPDNFEALCLMWGMVIGLGMRWKAFASADMAYSMDTENVAMDWYEAQLTLRYCVLFGNSPEWVHASKWDFASEWGPNGYKAKDPWGFGKGGGVTMDSSDLTFRSAKVPKEDVALSESNAEASWLFAGRRIRIQDLELNPELNGTKGTLVEEVQKDLWHVAIDGYGEKLLKVKNIAQIHTSTAAVETKVVSFRSQEQMCLAGNWDGWKSHDMHWDSEHHCSTLDVTLVGTSAATFAIQRGQAATLKWKPHLSPKKWSMGSIAGSFRIKVSIENSKIGHVEWERRDV
jgi:hypothetical protein|eukprot:CAMPEP_0169269860 /NCGR_PEP_ID=MMETSP1016-20121227/48724_1 /TAXON_ID=342587 /ORGANISM="Karlodinium micrum, Strain CCMP2283" /LENGTH=514 /DNA_ID=CAMNT_0009354997 /DNA_START=72 /DNA_END=1619 /DNA_ORIENTATION=+